MQQIDKHITIKNLQLMASNMFGDLVKAVVDIERKVVVIDAELHADEEQFLLTQGSKQQSLWGINLHPQDFGTDKFIEFDSMINIRPRQNNSSRDILDPDIRSQIIEIIYSKVIK